MSNSVAQHKRPRQKKHFTIYSLIKVFRRWLHLPDPGILIAAYAAYAANLDEGPPVWILLVSPPSSGKTVIIMALSKLQNVIPVSTLTEAALLSGTKSKERSRDASGGLLTAIGATGTILIKDFTSILSISYDARAGLLAALREIYDGQWDRAVGVDGGRQLSWKGKLAVIGGCTDVVDSHHAVISAMGDRFLMYRAETPNGRELALRALRQSSAENEMSKQLSAAVRSLFEGLPWAHHEQLSVSEKNRIASLAILTARCRSSVQRDARSREIELIPGSELPGRLAKALSQHFRAMLGIGTTVTDAWRVLTKIGLDCIPSVRRLVLEKIRFSEAELETSAVADSIGYPLSTTRRALEDLFAHKVLVRRSLGSGRTDCWRLAPETEDQCRVIFQNSAEKTGGRTVKVRSPNRSRKRRKATKLSRKRGFLNSANISFPGKVTQTAVLLGDDTLR